MPSPVRRSVRPHHAHPVRLRWPARLLLALFASGLAGVAGAAEDLPPSRAADLWIGPIAGLTTQWHPAPAETGVPLGARLRVGLACPPGSEVDWSGADETLADAGWSVAEVVAVRPGPQPVRAVYQDPGGRVRSFSVVLHAVPVGAGGVALSPVRVTADPVLPPPDAGFEEVLHAFRQPSIAGLTELGGDRNRTSVRRRLRLEVTVEPPELAPLIEWRLGRGAEGAPVRLGAAIEAAWKEPGFRRVWVGPPVAQRSVGLEIYRVDIAGPPIVVDGFPLTYRARTEPAGHEDEVTWLASTKYGEVEPRTGTGAEFTVLFRRSVRPEPAPGFEPGRWLGLRADHAVIEEDAKETEGRIVRLDPDFGFDPETDFPSRLPGPPRPDPGPFCEPGYELEVDPGVDRNGDGHPDIVAMRALDGGPACIDGHRYCVEQDGVFVEVPTGPGVAVLHPDVPIPVAAIGQGCAGFDQPVRCVELSDGDPAVCESALPSAECLTVTVCPEAGDWDDPGDPENRDVFDATDVEQTAAGLEVPPEDQLDPAAASFIHPCEWDAAAGEEVTVSLLEGSSDEYQVALDRGNDRWGVHLEGGIVGLTARVERALFHPSTGFELSGEMRFDLDARALGQQIPLISARGVATSSNCQDQSELGLRVDGEEVQPDVETENDPASVVGCQVTLGLLRGTERSVNEALHDALIAWSFYNLVGAAGAPYPDLARTQAYTDAYRRLATEIYPSLVDAARASEERVRDQPAFTRSSLPDLMPTSRPLSKAIRIGPFEARIELALIGAADVLVEVAPESDFQPDACPGVECRRTEIGMTLTPKVDVNAYAFLSAGISLGRFAGVKGGVRGVLELADLQLPIGVRIGVAQSVEQRAPDLVLPPQAEGLVALLPPGSLGAEQLLTPTEASYSAPYDYFALLDGEFLGGRLELVVRAWLLFWDFDWSKRLASWNGVRRTWHVGLPLADTDDIAALADQAPLGSLAGMLTLPELNVLGPAGAPLPAEEAAQRIQDELGMRFPSHGILDLGEPGEPWVAERCFTPPG